MKLKFIVTAFMFATVIYFQFFFDFKKFVENGKRKDTPVEEVKF